MTVYIFCPLINHFNFFQFLFQKLKLIYDASPPDKKPSPIPPELWDRLASFNNQSKISSSVF